MIITLSAEITHMISIAIITQLHMSNYSRVGEMAASISFNPETFLFRDSFSLHLLTQLHAEFLFCLFCSFLTFLPLLLFLLSKLASGYI